MTAINQDESYRLQGAPGSAASIQPVAVIPHAAGQAWVEERTRVAVARNVNVSGRLIFQEPVRIEGRFRGEVSSSDLVVISEHGSVDGRVRSPRILILGELRGDIAACKQVVLGPRARFLGQLEAETLTVCEGASLEGDVKMGLDRAALEPTHSTG